MGSPGQEVASRPDHVLMSRAFFRLAGVQILQVKHICDHCTMSLRFLVEKAGMHADWSLSAGHRCTPGGCGEHLALRWQPDRSTAYVAWWAAQPSRPDWDSYYQKDLEKACCLLWSSVKFCWEPGVDVTRAQSLCAHFKRSWGAARDPPWFWGWRVLGYWLKWGNRGLQ